MSAVGGFCSSAVVVYEKSSRPIRLSPPSVSPQVVAFLADEHMGYPEVGQAADEALEALQALHRKLVCTSLHTQHRPSSPRNATLHYSNGRQCINPTRSYPNRGIPYSTIVV